MRITHHDLEIYGLNIFREIWLDERYSQRIRGILNSESFSFLKNTVILRRCQYLARCLRSSHIKPCFSFLNSIFRV